MDFLGNSPRLERQATVSVLPEPNEHVITMNMVRSQRLYCWTNPDDWNIPIHPAALRDLFGIVANHKAHAFFVDGFFDGSNEAKQKPFVFLTARSIGPPLGYKRICWSRLGPHMDTSNETGRWIILAAVEFLANEALEEIYYTEVNNLSVQFLATFDDVLRIETSDNRGSNAISRKYLTSYNFRTLRHRIMTMPLSASEIDWLRENHAEKTEHLLRLFQ